MITAQQIILEVLGSISWNLPSRMEYTPNTPINFQMQVGNPTAQDRSYSLRAVLTKGGQSLWSGFISVDGAEWFSVAAGKAATLSGSFTLDQNGVVLTVGLAEQSTNSIVGQVSAELAAPGGGTGDALSSIMPLLSLGLVFGMITPLMKGFKRTE
jgi:hypothetical protein